MPDEAIIRMCVVCVCVLLYVCIYDIVYLLMFEFVCMYVYIYVCIYICMYVCRCICMYMCMCVRIYMYMYVYMYLYVCVSICMYVCIYMQKGKKGRWGPEGVQDPPDESYSTTPGEFIIIRGNVLHQVTATSCDRVTISIPFCSKYHYEQVYIKY
jgi:hypothetical protein